MANGLSGKSAIVTGAARGVGLAIARRLTRAGANVMMADEDENRLEIESEAIAAAGYDGRATPFFGDLGQKLGMANLMAATLDAHEGVDILVNGSRLLATSEPLDPEADRFDAVVAHNVTATLRLTQIVARRMIEHAEAEAERGAAGDRSILNLSSVYARRTLPELLAFSASCAALEQVTRTLAMTLAPHCIRVNAVAVGGVPMRGPGEAPGDADPLRDPPLSAVPLGRLGEPQDVAEAALFLASPCASFVTGQILAVDGGRSVRDVLDDAR